MGTSSRYDIPFGPSEWTQYRMKSDKNAVYDNELDSLESKTFQTAGEVRATPVVVGNKLFVGNHKSGDVFAFDVNTGKELWSNKVPNWVHSEMIYHDGKVYVGAGNRMFQDDGTRGMGTSGVYAFDAETGKLIWEHQTDGEVMPTPVYRKGAIYAVTGDSHLYKLDSETGKLIKKAAINSRISMSSPANDGGKLYMGGVDKKRDYFFSAYDMKKDTFEWQKFLPAVTEGLDDVPPAVDQDIVVTTAVERERKAGKMGEHFIYAFRTDSGKLLWKKSLGTGRLVKNNKSGAPMIYKDKVYLGSPMTKTFYAFDLKTGKKVWEFENERIKAPPVAKNDVVYFANAKGLVCALDTETGKEVGKVALDGVLAPSGPTIINDTLFVGSQNTKVYAVPLKEFYRHQKTD